MKLACFLLIATFAKLVGPILAFQSNAENIVGRISVDRSSSPIAYKECSSSPKLQAYPATVSVDSGEIATGKITPLDFIVFEIASHDVVVFSTTYCRYCVETKDLFRRMNINPRIIELDQLSNGLGPDNSIALKLFELTGQSTVPNVFIKGMHLGGNDVTQEVARTGELARFLNQNKNNLPV